jgi:hypothetical protein
VEHIACVLGVEAGLRETCGEHRSCLVTGGLHVPPPSLVALVPDGEQGKNRFSGIHEVLLIELRESSVGSHLHCVMHVVRGG